MSHQLLPGRKVRNPQARRLLLEKMEDRRLLALLTHDYELNGSYADELGGPALVQHYAAASGEDWELE